MGLFSMKQNICFLFCLVVCSTTNVQGTVVRDNKANSPLQIETSELNFPQEINPSQYQLIQQLLESYDSLDNEDLKNEIDSANSQKFDPRVARYSMGHLTHVESTFKDQAATNALLDILGRDNQPSNSCLDNAMPMVKDLDDLVFAFQMCF